MAFNLVPSGTILPFGGATAPSGWLLCDGASVAIASYPALNNAIGVLWGNPGGGSFNLPNLTGSFVRGIGTSGAHVGPATVGAVQTHATAKNNLNISSNAAPNSHTHGSSGMAAGITFSTYNTNSSFFTALTRNTYATYGATNSRAVINTSPAAIIDPDTGSSNQPTVAVLGSTDTNSGTAVTLGNGDSETRPNSKGVNYIIKI